MGCHMPHPGPGFSLLPDCWRSLRVPLIQAYAWPGLADIFPGLVLRLLGWEGKVRIQRIEIACGEGLQVQRGVHNHGLQALRVFAISCPLTWSVPEAHSGAGTIYYSACYLLCLQLNQAVI